MLIDGADEVYFIDRDNCVYQVSSLTFLHRKDKNRHISDTLLGNHYILLLQLSFYLLFLLHLNLINIPIRHQLYIIYLCYTPVDGEMVIDTVQGQKFPRYLVYDIIRFIFFYSFLYIAISRNLQNSRIT